MKNHFAHINSFLAILRCQTNRISVAFNSRFDFQMKINNLSFYSKKKKFVSIVHYPCFIFIFSRFSGYTFYFKDRPFDRLYI